MSRIVAVCVLVALGLASVEGNTVLPVSFCERYSAALFSVSNSTTQTQLITAVLTRALFGGTGGGITNVGILNWPLQQAFFNGSVPGGSGTNYYTNSAALTSLFNKLVNFFSVAMQCRAVATTAVANMNVIHGAFNIRNAVWTQFVNEVVQTLLEYGVPNPTPAYNSDITYAGALLGQFLRGSPQAICTAADCAAWSPFAEFFVFQDATTSFRWFNSAGWPNITIASGGTVHWNFNTHHNVAQTDSTYLNVVSGGFGSGSVRTSTGTFTMTFNTAGTFYFICQAHPTTMRAWVTVTGSSSASSSTGSSSPASSSFPVSLAVVVASIASVLALRRF